MRWKSDPDDVDSFYVILPGVITLKHIEASNSQMVIVAIAEFFFDKDVISSQHRTSNGRDILSYKPLQVDEVANCRNVDLIFNI